MGILEISSAATAFTGASASGVSLAACELGCEADGPISTAWEGADLLLGIEGLEALANTGAGGSLSCGFVGLLR